MKSALCIFMIVLPISSAFATDEEFVTAKGTYEALKSVANQIKDNLKYLNTTKNYLINGNNLEPVSDEKLPKSYIGDLKFIPSLNRLNDSAKTYFNTENLDYSFLRKMIFNSFKALLDVVPGEIFEKIKDLHKDKLSLAGQIRTMTELKHTLQNLLYKIDVIKNAQSKNPTYFIKK